MTDHVLVWDLETVPDLPCVARVHSIDERDQAACREALGDKFPKLPFHKIACIGALIAERQEGGWQVLEAPASRRPCESWFRESLSVACGIGGGLLK